MGAVAAALRMPGAFNARLMVPAHLLLAAALAAETARLDRARHTPQAVAAFYRGVWNLFYAGALPPGRPAASTFGSKHFPTCGSLSPEQQQPMPCGLLVHAQWLLHRARMHGSSSNHELPGHSLLALP